MANERLTEFHLTYDMSDITALKDSTPSTTFNKSFADITLLKAMVETPGQMTLEHNYCSLDGTQDEFDNNPTTLAFFTNTMSDENGEFENNPVIDVGFTQMHSSYALTLNFIDDYPLRLKCTWYQDSVIVFANTYNVDDNNFIIRQSVANYNRIVIEFLKTLPYRYVKLNFIRYGMLIKWNPENLKTGKLLYENDPISSKLSNNTLTYEVIDVDDETNPGNLEGLHNYFQKTQIMYPYEIINGQKIDLGKFYLRDFSYQKNVCKINAFSFMGLLESLPFNEGNMYDMQGGKSAGELLLAILTKTGLTSDDIYIDTNIANFKLFGALPPTTCKSALQQILFVCNAIIDTTDMEKIKVVYETTSIAGMIYRSNKLSTKVTRKDYVSGVEIKYTSYVLDSSQTAQEVVKGTFNAGTHEILLSQPYRSYSSSTCTIISYTDFSVKFSVANDDTAVVITANGYQAIQNSVVVRKSYIEGGEGDNIKSFATTLCNAETARNLAAKVLDYYSNRLEIDIKHLPENANINERRIVQNSNIGFDDYVGMFTKRSIDLAGGFIDNATLIGHYNTEDYDYYMVVLTDGAELILDESYATDVQGGLI